MKEVESAFQQWNAVAGEELLGMLGVEQQRRALATLGGKLRARRASIAQAFARLGGERPIRTIAATEWVVLKLRSVARLMGKSGNFRRAAGRPCSGKVRLRRARAQGVEERLGGCGCEGRPYPPSHSARCRLLVPFPRRGA